LDYIAFQYYQEGNNASANILFEEFITGGNETEDVRFFLGLSYLYSNKSIDAISHFEWILNRKETSYKDAATWFIALALTDSDRYNEAKRYLIEVSNLDQNKGKRELAKKAKTLLDALD